MSLKLRRERLDVDVGDVIAGQKVAVEALVREDIEGPPAAIIVCLTGGGVTREFYDLRLGDNASFSLAEAMADRGYAVVLIDHLGVGESTCPDDAYELVPDVMADANAAAARAAIALIRDGGLGTGPCNPPVYGLGHSMGAMVSVLIQARHALYEGLILLGYVVNGQPESMRPGALAAAHDPQRIRAELKALTTEMFNEPIKFVAPRKPGSPPRDKPKRMTDEAASRLFRPEAADPDGTLALKAALAPVINVTVLFAIIPGSHTPEMAQIKVPILVIVGEYDFCFPPRDLEKLFSNAPSIETFLPDGIGHNIFNFPTRGEVFDRISGWVGERLTERVETAAQ